MNDFQGRIYNQEKVFEPSVPIAQAMQEAAVAVDDLRANMPAYDAAAMALMRHLQMLTQAVDTVQQHCTVVMQERDQYGQMLTAAQQRLTEVQRVVQRYTVVQDPVVASDGYTYERRTIKQYLDDCARTHAPPVSQQTREELTSTLVPNQSLKKLVDLLKSVKADNTVPLMKDDVRNNGSSGDMNGGAGGYTRGPSTLNEGRLHPCNRVYGYCNYKETCTYASYPYDACLSYLKGKCRFGPQCHELHVDFRRPKKDGPPSAAQTH